MGACCSIQTPSDSVDIAMTDMSNGIWQFQDDNGGWISMNPQDSDNIHAAYQSQKTQYQFQRWKYLYEIDFKQMTQTNTGTNRSRPIRYHIPSEQDNASESDKKEETASFDTNDIEDGGYRWQWLIDTNQWCDYDHGVNDQLECCYLSDQKSCAIEINNSPYEVHLDKKLQINATTHNSRKIRRTCTKDTGVEEGRVDIDTFIVQDDDHKSESDAGYLDEEKKEDTFDTNDIEYGGYRWQCWLSDKNKWCDYDRAVNDRLESCYLSKQNSCAIEINNNEYEVDFDKKVQINVATHISRKIRRIVENGRVDIDARIVRNDEENDDKSRYQWQCWLSDKEVWCDYNTEHNAELERCYQSNQRICDLKLGGNTYKIYLDEMVQTNAKTNVSRKIQRKSVAIEYTEYIWEWRDNDKQFKRYPPAVSTQLEAIYLDKDRERTSVIKKFGSQCYEIKPLQFKQINKATQFSRAIRRVNANGDGANDEDDAAALWQWKDDGAIWRNYDAETSKYIESKYKMRNEKFEIDLSVNIGSKKRKMRYEIDLKDLKQTNPVTKGARYIRRIRVHSEDDIIDGQRDDVDQWRGPLRKTYGNEIKTLYHITGGEAAQAINKTKRMIRGRDGMFGGGIYFAETVSDAQHKSENKGGWLITAKVFTGKALQLQHGNAGKYDFNSLSKKECDSIYAPKGGGYGKAEWCVFNWDQVLVVKVNKM